MNLKKTIYIIIGCIGLVLGAIGAVVPLLPAFPFLLLAAYCFARSSKRLHDWFVSTNLYKKNLESYVQGKGMTIKVKIRIMTVVSLTMLVGFLMMGKVPIGRMILGIVWLCHILYFAFGIRTIKEEKSNLPCDLEFEE